MAKARARVLISGLVQGVFFRHNMRQMAESLSVTGWVRNTFDGSVEATVEGDAGDIDRLIEWCRTGPPAAEVEDVKVERSSYTGEFAGFHVRR